ncbi:putative membrane protein [Chlamydia ibidis 10-1398/6]|uniref:Membrane protein n=1 Tax=Chlamydia ibidis 10-1398/6 TaxID=1046581 RepID=A0ABP2XFF8_9CHLA|nr:putative membrane protein [Chlamydia ibidis 10-1398/6]
MIIDPDLFSGFLFFCFPLLFRSSSLGWGGFVLLSSISRGQLLF